MPFCRRLSAPKAHQKPSTAKLLHAPMPTHVRLNNPEAVLSTSIISNKCCWKIHGRLRRKATWNWFSSYVEKRFPSNWQFEMLRVINLIFIGCQCLCLCRSQRGSTGHLRARILRFSFFCAMKFSFHRCGERLFRLHWANALNFNSK